MKLKELRKITSLKNLVFYIRVKSGLLNGIYKVNPKMMEFVDEFLYKLLIKLSH